MRAAGGRLAAAGLADQPERLARARPRTTTPSTALTVADLALEQIPRVTGKCFVEVLDAEQVVAIARRSTRLTASPAGAARRRRAPARELARRRWQAAACSASPATGARAAALARGRRRSRSGQRGVEGGSRAGRSISVRRHARDRRQPLRRRRVEPRQRAEQAPACTGARARRRASSTSAVSTIRPAYITSTRSATLGDDAEVVRDQDDRRAELALQVLHQRRGSAPGSSRRARWSARRRSAASGLQASAIAIITRWRMPPENWCG